MKALGTNFLKILEVPIPSNRSLGKKFYGHFSAVAYTGYLAKLQKGVTLLLIELQSSSTTPNERESSQYVVWSIVSRP